MTCEQPIQHDLSFLIQAPPGFLLRAPSLSLELPKPPKEPAPPKSLLSRAVEEWDPTTSAELFQKYNIRPSAYDVELWLFRPERTASMLQVIRYNAEGQTLDTYDFQSKGKPPTRNIPPDSSIEVIWELLTATKTQAPSTSE
jgi:hypothetical protein